MKRMYIIIFSALSVVFFVPAQTNKDYQINEQENKYMRLYFDAEKYKLLEDYDSSEKKYKECIAINSNDPAAFFELAKIFWLRSDISTAKNYALKAVEMDQKNKWYHYFLVQLYRYQFDHESEAETWENLILIDPFNLDYYFDAALAYLEYSNYKKALKKLKDYEKKVGYSEKLFLLKSKIFEQKGDDKKQLKCFKNGIETFPKSILLLENLAQYYIEKSEYILANSIYEKIVLIDPDNSTALLASYTICQNKKAQEEEKQIFIKIINSPQVQEIKKQELLLDILTQEDRLNFYYEEIPFLLESCISLYPETSFFYTILADFYALDTQYILARDNYLLATLYDSNAPILWERAVYMSLLENNYKQVIIDSNLALQLFPLQGILYYYKGLAEFYEKLYNESTQTLNNGLVYIIDNKPLLTGMYETLGNAYHELAEQDLSSTYHQKSDESYEKALSYDPTNEYILNNYSYYLSLRGENLELAKEMIERCISMSTKPNPSFLDTYAWVLFKLKDYNDAQKIMKQCIQHGGESAIILEHYGDILQALGLLEEAIFQWEKALNKDLANEGLKQKILNLKND